MSALLHRHGFMSLAGAEEIPLSVGSPAHLSIDTRQKELRRLDFMDFLHEITVEPWATTGPQDTFESRAALKAKTARHNDTSVQHHTLTQTCTVAVAVHYC